ncbi:hypothetical protein BaRGS_00007488, partial [Batillaria attramentaria]
TNFFMKENKYFTTVNFFLPFAYVMILGFFFTETTEKTSVMHRDQTEEWKGWMQLVILIYHLTGASKVLPVYMHIRLLVSCYLFLTGYAHFTYFWQRGDYSLLRFCMVLFRMNLLVVTLCFVMNRPYQFYYFVPLVSFWFLVVYLVMAIWPHVTQESVEDDSIHEWRFRWQLDRHSVVYGMLFAFGYQILLRYKLIEDNHRQHLFSRPISWTSYFTFSLLCSSKPQCNDIHSYIVFIPIVSYIMLRNVPGWLRTRYSSFFAWFGKISLELFICQYHIWLAADTHGVLVLLPSYPVLNVVVTSIILICVAHEVSVITHTLTKYAVPDDWKAMLRNLIVFLAILLPAPAVKEEVLPQYEEYLLLLQERNRLLKRLQRKDQKDVQLERKEKGFSIYMNGANTDLPAPSSGRVRPRVKTATESRNPAVVKLQDLQRKEAENSKRRVKTAPARERRRNWNVSSVDITTTDGQRKKLKAPEILSGKYADDFEEDDSDEKSDASEDDGISESVNSSTSSLSTPRRQKTSYLKRKAAAIREMENTVMLSLADVHKLRQSLETNSRIRQSVCLDMSTDESEDEREPPIEEEDEIEEDLVPAMDSVSLENLNKKQCKQMFGPTDTIVLEFAAPATKQGKVEKSLMLARKKDAPTDLPIRISSASKPPSSASTSRKSASSDQIHGSTGQSKDRAVKLPLSAGRRNTESREDSKAEASAVLRALQEENQKVERFAKGARPLPEPGNKGRPTSGHSQNRVPTPKNSSQEPGRRDSQDADQISSIVQRVLSMAPKQQRDLMKTISKIDDSVAEANGLKFPLNKPIKATAPLSSVTSSQGEKSGVEVTIEIKSNWGNASRVGLTEIQLLDSTGSLLPVAASGVSAHGSHEASGPPGILFNGKAKTTKERNMWSCRWTGRPVELCIQTGQGQQSHLGALRIWNWNKSITELDVGARHVRVFVGGTLVFDGEVDKGCGNHIFDYSKTISVSEKLKPSPSKSPLEAPGKLNRLTSPAKGSNPPHSPLPATSSSLSNRGLTSPLKGEIPSVPNDGHHHTFRSISRSSASSASSSGSHPSRPSSQNEERGQIRSETRTMMRPSGLARQTSWGSDQSSPENEHPDKDSMPEKKVSKTPRLTKRLAARLDGKASDTDTSKSNADSCEQKPPLPPDKSIQKSADKMARSSDKLAPKSSKSEPMKSPRALPTPSVGSTSGKGKVSDDEAETSIVEQLKDMGSKENKRKKDVPRWLSAGEAAELRGKTPSENGGSRKSTQSSKQQDDDDDIHSLLDEEFAQFSQSQAGSVPSTPQPSMSPEKSKSVASSNQGEASDSATPMQQIQNKRARWRTKQTEDLEETWGSLSFFNKSHRGRLSLDMADDILDEYLSSPTKKPDPVTQLPIPEEGFPEDDDSFVIPELPSGQELVINIQSTWGDKHYVGLTSIQVFASTGEQVQVKKISAEPSDINILPDYDRDPRVVVNLLDGVNRTRDDTHMWLAPFTAGKNHFVYLTLAKKYSIALIRIWNYNKSRIHSYRGAKDIIMTLDGTVIFKGEIARACGGVEGDTEAFGDTILFTMDEGILEAVSRNDDAFEGEMLSDEEDVPFQRPSTADNEDEEDKDRPFTRAAGQLKKEKEKETPRPTTSMVTFAGDILIYKTHKLELNFTATWGDLHYLGLTALEVVGKDGEAVPLSMSMLSASPCDITHLKGHERDDRTLDKLINGTVVTMSDEHMWLIPFSEGQNHTLTITFPQETLVSGLRIWNYNKSPEDTYRGARIVHISVNDRVISPPEGFLVRKGPGNCHFDFAQEITFTPADSSGSQATQSTVIYQLQLFSTWGDPYYVGLNGIEFYDASFNKITLTESNISAHPNSVAVLEQMQHDVRTPDKLIDGQNDTMDGRHMWLAPILPGMLNRVYVIFDQPTSVSMIKIWNYSKTPPRGVKDLALLVDDLLVYNGTLQAVRGGARGILPTAQGPQEYHTILFTDNKEVLRKEKHTIISKQQEDQDVQLLNDKKIVTKHADPNRANSGKPVNQALRPKTSVTEINKRRR